MDGDQLPVKIGLRTRRPRRIGKSLMVLNSGNNESGFGSGVYGRLQRVCDT